MTANNLTAPLACDAPPTCDQSWSLAPLPCSLLSPRFIRFQTPLTQPECESLMEFLYEGKNPPLWGNPMRLGPTKWHVYGCDRKHWKASNLEITASIITAVFPEMGDTLETRLRELVASRHPILANVNVLARGESATSSTPKTQ